MVLTLRKMMLIGAAALAVLALAPLEMLAQDSSADGPVDEPGLMNLMCPVTSGEEVDPSFFAEYRGQRVYFCCKRCLQRFNQDPSAYGDRVGAVMPASFLAREGNGQQQNRAPEETAQDDDAVSDADHEDSQNAEYARETSVELKDSADHDHETKHGVSPIAKLGRLHVVAVHFPLALLLLAACLEIGGLLRGAWRTDSAVRLLFLFGTLGAIVAMALGLIHGSADDYLGTLSWVFWWHRALGISTAIAAVATSLLIVRRGRRADTHDRSPASVAVILTAVLVGVTGHFGGSLVFGWNYLIP